MLNRVLNVIEEYSKSNSTYSIKIIRNVDEIRKKRRALLELDVLGLCNIVDNKTKQEYDFVFSEWGRNKDYYFLVYPNYNKTYPWLEARKVSIIGNNTFLSWRYIPSKRDGRNEERKEKFKHIYNDVCVEVKLPHDIKDVATFIEEIFNVVATREKSDILE